MSAVPTTNAAKRLGKGTVLLMNNTKHHGEVHLNGKDGFLDLYRDDGKRLTIPLERLYMIEWDFEE